MIPLLLLVGGLVTVFVTQYDVLGYILIGLGAAFIVLPLILLLAVGRSIRKNYRF